MKLDERMSLFLFAANVRFHVCISGDRGHGCRSPGIEIDIEIDIETRRSGNRVVHAFQRERGARAARG